jgi:hypothetical protein
MIHFSPFNVNQRTPRKTPTEEKFNEPTYDQRITARPYEVLGERNDRDMNGERNEEPDGIANTIAERPKAATQMCFRGEQIVGDHLRSFLVTEPV